MAAAPTFTGEQASRYQKQIGRGCRDLFWGGSVVQALAVRLIRDLNVFGHRSSGEGLD